MESMELVLLAFGLAMDGFAVSVCKGLNMKQGTSTMGKAAATGIWFGGSQLLLLLLGYSVGIQFQRQITSLDHWIACLILIWIGGTMIRESDPCAYNNTEEDGFSKKQMLWLAAATGMDALAEGLTFAMVGGSGFTAAVVTITMVTVGMSAIGVMTGNLAGCWLKRKTNLAGGVILIILGVKILLEHLGILNF